MNLDSQQKFLKNLVVINVGNKVGVAYHMKEHQGTGLRGVCTGAGWERLGIGTQQVCETPGQQHRSEAPKGRAFRERNTINMQTP